MLENHVQTVSYVLSSIALVLSGDSITKDIVIPFIKSVIKDSPPLWSIFIGTILFIGWCYFGALLIGKFLLNTDIINRNNVDFIAIVGFVVLSFILNTKYHFGW
jgi:hypothetical protein